MWYPVPDALEYCTGNLNAQHGSHHMSVLLQDSLHSITYPQPFPSPAKTKRQCLKLWIISRKFTPVQRSRVKPVFKPQSPFGTSKSHNQFHGSMLKFSPECFRVKGRARLNIWFQTHLSVKTIFLNIYILILTYMIYF